MTPLVDRLIDGQLEKALQIAVDGSPLLLTCRQADTLDRLRNVAATAFLLDTQDVPADSPPDAALQAAASAVGEGLLRIGEIITDATLHHVLFIVVGPRVGTAWTSIAGMWAATRKKGTSGPSLCIVNPSGPVPAGCQRLDDGAFIGPAESLLVARMLRRDPLPLAEAADQVAIECASGDLDILKALLAFPEQDRFAPVLQLERLSARAGSTTIWRGREESHAAWLARHDLPALQRRIWRGQLLILFPWMEALREAFIARQGPRIDMGWRDQDGGPLEVGDYEWGHITTALQRISNGQASQAANSIRHLRNALAHSQPVEYQVAVRAVAAGDSLLALR